MQSLFLTCIHVLYVCERECECVCVLYRFLYFILGIHLYSSKKDYYEDYSHKSAVSVFYVSDLETLWQSCCVLT